MSGMKHPLCCGGTHTRDEHEAFMERLAEEDARVFVGVSYDDDAPQRPPAPPIGPRLGDAPEAARILGVSVATVYKRTQRGQLPRGAVVYTGRRVQYRLDLLVR